jgi:hypothetical protein
MALIIANYEFIYVDIGKKGRISDTGVLEWTSCYDQLKWDKLNFQTNEEHENLKFVIIGDEGFSLHKHILKPYSQKDLTREKQYLITDY